MVLPPPTHTVFWPIRVLSSSNFFLTLVSSKALIHLIYLHPFPSCAVSQATKDSGPVCESWDSGEKIYLGSSVRVQSTICKWHGGGGFIHARAVQEAERQDTTNQMAFSKTTVWPCPVAGTTHIRVCCLLQLNLSREAPVLLPLAGDRYVCNHALHK